MSDLRPRRAAVAAAAAAVIAGWGIAGLFQMPRWSDDGYHTDSGHTIVTVDSGGPAQIAGLESGDRIISIGGVPVAELAAPPRRSVPAIGALETVVVERDGRELQVELVHGAYPCETFLLPRINMGVVAVVFVCCGMWATLAVETAAGLLFALFCFTLGFAMFEGPRVGSLEGLAGLLEVTCGLLATVFLLHFLLSYPAEKRILRWRAMVRWLYGPVLVFVAAGIVDLLVDPALYLAFASATLLLVLVYGLGAATALGHTLVKFPRREWSRSGVSVMLLGLAIALAPFLLMAITRVTAPDVELPGSGFYTLSAVAIPIAMALAVRRHAGQYAVVEPDRSSPAWRPAGQE